MVERIFFISYPFDLEPESTSAWAAAFHQLVQQYHGIDMEVSVLASEYGVQVKEIEQAIAQIEGIEKISYPNI